MSSEARGDVPITATGVNAYGDAQRSTSGATSGAASATVAVRGEHADNTINQPSDLNATTLRYATPGELSTIELERAIDRDRSCR
jgi:hypothetical protein